MKRFLIMISALLICLLLLCGCGGKAGTENMGKLVLDYETKAEQEGAGAQVTAGESGFRFDDNKATAVGNSESSSPDESGMAAIYAQGTIEIEQERAAKPSDATQPSSTRPPQIPGKTPQADEKNNTNSESGDARSETDGTYNAGDNWETPTQPSQPEQPSTTPQPTLTPQPTPTPTPEPTPEPKQTVTITIRCDTAVNNGMHMESKWAGIVPASGCILPVTEVEIKDGWTVFDVLAFVCDKYKIHMSYRGGTSSGCYVDGINNLYEFDGGRWSGWMYCVNDWYPNYGCGVYFVKAGDVIEWNYTCDLGLDLDGSWWEGAQEWKDTHD